MSTSLKNNSANNDGFEQLQLMPSILKRIQQLGYNKPTAIQSRAIPAVLAGQDVLAGANTGSGKTAAFALPVLHSLIQNPVSRKGANYAQVLVLVPTRELAVQVTESFQSYAAEVTPKLKLAAVFGGVSVNSQMLALRGGADVLVATPGRLLDLQQSNAINLSKVSTLVLDEADRMLSLGFADELSAILALVPKQRQTLMFSATFPDEVKAITAKHLQSPVEIEIQRADESTVQQQVYTVNRNQKTALLSELIKQNQWRQVLVFASAKNSCNRVAQKLEKAGISAQVFHSDKAQGARNRILTEFKQGEIAVLVATDIAARGIDIAKLPVVINYELPRSPSDYMHRIGRSGRAGETGLAISLISHDEYHHFKVIEKRHKIRLPRQQYVGFEADDEAPADCPSRQEKPQAKPAGTGKKHRKKAAQANQAVWQQAKLKSQAEK
ncbi:DEAD/DEAH box helicase [Shewanella waksmanii]|uniref:DEAD/DEAH box helicase n=1 Tax=Shewanella waksmanii TaxID=213783 RepID=UPI003734D1D7